MLRFPSIEADPIAAGFATSHDDDRAVCRAAQERSDERFVVGMSADPEDSLRRLNRANPREQQQHREDHDRVIRLSRSKRKKR